MPAIAEGFYGAIALDTTHPQAPAYGFSFHFTTKSAAERKAVTECRAHSITGRCHVVLWVHNRCGAVVHAQEFVGGVGRTKRAAVADARARAGAARARLLVWTCSG